MWDPRPFDDVDGKTIGVVGMGPIAREVIRLATRPRHAPDRHAPRRARRRALRDVDARPPAASWPALADVLAIALPLTDDTRGIVSADVIAAMRPGAVFVNVGRGDLVDEPALVGGAGVRAPRRRRTRRVRHRAAPGRQPAVGPAERHHHAAQLGEHAARRASPRRRSSSTTWRATSAASRCTTSADARYCPPEPARYGPHPTDRTRRALPTRAPPRYCRPHRHPPGPSRPHRATTPGRSPVPVTVLWAAKGGSGTTVVTASLALSCPTDSLLVDLAGDLPAALGIAAPTGQGIGDWLASDAPPSGARRPRRRRRPHDPPDPPRPRPSTSTSPRWPELVDWLARRTGRVRRRRHRARRQPACCTATSARCSSPVPATSGCSAPSPRRCRPDGVVLVCEPGRTLRAADVERSIGAPGRGVGQRRRGRQPAPSTPACSPRACRACCSASCGARHERGRRRRAPRRRALPGRRGRARRRRHRRAGPPAPGRAAGRTGRR